MYPFLSGNGSKRFRPNKSALVAYSAEHSGRGLLATRYAPAIIVHRHCRPAHPPDAVHPACAQQPWIHAACAFPTCHNSLPPTASSIPNATTTTPAQHLSNNNRLNLCKPHLHILYLHITSAAAPRPQFDIINHHCITPDNLNYSYLFLASLAAMFITSQPTPRASPVPPPASRPTRVFRDENLQHGTCASAVRTPIPSDIRDGSDDILRDKRSSQPATPARIRVQCHTSAAHSSAAVRRCGRDSSVSHRVIPQIGT